MDIDRRHGWVFIPDVSVTLRERLAGRFFKENKPVDVLPNFAIEVLSPDDRPGRVTRKIAHYMQSGVRLLWFIDPEEQEVTAWRPGETPESVSAPGTITANPVLPDLSVELTDLFSVIKGKRQGS